MAGTTDAKSRNAEKAARLKKLAGELASFARKIRRGEDYFIARRVASSGCTHAVETVRGRELARVNWPALRAFVNRGWILSNGIENGGECYAITPAGWDAVRRADQGGCS